MSGDKPIIDVDALVHPLHGEITAHLAQIMQWQLDLQGVIRHTKELLTECGCENCREVLAQIPEDI